MWGLKWNPLYFRVVPKSKSILHFTQARVVRGAGCALNAEWVYVRFTGYYS
jgi:hypothetical protein